MNFNESNPVRPSRGPAGRVWAGRQHLEASYLCTHFASIEITVITRIPSTLQDTHSSHSKSGNTLPLCPWYSSPTPAWLTPLSTQVSSPYERGLPPRTLLTTRAHTEHQFSLQRVLPLPRSSFLGYCLSPFSGAHECRDQTV